MRASAAGRTNKFARLLLSLGITLPLSLAPLLLKLPIPQLSPFLTLIPPSTRNVAVPFLAAALTLVAVLIEVDNKERISDRIKVARFRRSLAYCAVCLILLLLTYAKVVTLVRIPGKTTFASFVTGWPASQSTPCEGMGPADCISKQSRFNESSTAAHFGERKVRLASFALEGLYILSFLTLGLSIARLLEMREASRLTFGDRRKAPAGQA